MTPRIFKWINCIRFQYTCFNIKILNLCNHFSHLFIISCLEVRKVNFIQASVVFTVSTKSSVDALQNTCNHGNTTNFMLFFLDFTPLNNICLCLLKLYVISDFLTNNSVSSKTSAFLKLLHLLFLCFNFWTSFVFNVICFPFLMFFGTLFVSILIIFYHENVFFFIQNFLLNNKYSANNLRSVSGLSMNTEYNIQRIILKENPDKIT